MPTRLVSIRLPEDLLDAIDQIAESTGRTRTDVIIMAVRAAMHRSHPHTAVIHRPPLSTPRIRRER